MPDGDGSAIGPTPARCWPAPWSSSSASRRPTTCSCSACRAAACRSPRRCAARLGGALDVLAVRKIGAPGHHELAIGAVAVGRAGRAQRRRDRPARGGRRGDRAADRRRPRRSWPTRSAACAGIGPVPGPTGRIVIARRRRPGDRRHDARRRAARSARPAGAGRRRRAGRLARRLRPARRRRRRRGLPAAGRADFIAVGQWYADFSPTTDDDVLRAARGVPLTRAAAARRTSTAPAPTANSNEPTRATPA